MCENFQEKTSRNSYAGENDSGNKSNTEYIDLISNLRMYSFSMMTIISLSKRMISMKIEKEEKSTTTNT